LTTRVFPGDLFFLHDRPAEVCRTITADCDAGQPGRSAV
jgi:surfactin synthase thioesterase subunit